MTIIPGHSLKVHVGPAVMMTAREHRELVRDLDARGVADDTLVPVWRATTSDVPGRFSVPALSTLVYAGDDDGVKRQVAP